MRRLHVFLLVLSLLIPVSLSGQNSDRQSVLGEARRLKSIYKTEAAIDLLSTLVSAESFDAEVLGELADCHMQVGNLEAAASTYELLSLRDPKNILYKVRMMNIAYRLKGYPACAEMGRAILQLDTIPAMVSLTGDAFNQMEIRDSALAYYNMYLRINPYNTSVLSKAARIHLDRKEFESVHALVDNYLQADSSDMDVRAIKGLAYYLKGEYKKSEEVFRKMEDDGNDSYNVHFYLGQSQWHNNRYRDAETELQMAWQIDSSDVNLAYTIGAVLLEGGHGMDAARPWLDRAVEMISPNPATLARIYREYGLGYLRSERFEPAIDYYLRSYELDRESFSALSSVAYCYEKLKDWKHAREYYELYLTRARKGSRGYNFAVESLDYVKQQLFMEEK